MLLKKRREKVEARSKFRELFCYLDYNVKFFPI